LLQRKIRKAEEIKRKIIFYWHFLQTLEKWNEKVFHPYLHHVYLCQTLSLSVFLSSPLSLTRTHTPSLCLSLSLSFPLLSLPLSVFLCLSVSLFLFATLYVFLCFFVTLYGSSVLKQMGAEKLHFRYYLNYSIDPGEKVFIPFRREKKILTFFF